MRLYTEIKDLQKTTLGRHVYDETGALELPWSLSGFAVRFIGQRAIIHFRADHRTEATVYMKADVDGNESKYGIIDGGSKIVLDDLGDGEHTLILRRVSAGEMTSVKVSAFELHGENCEVLAAPEMPELKIQFFGDSITCGYGVLGDSATRTYSTFEEDATKTYAYLTAKALGADMRVCAISGQGICSDCAGEHGTLFSEFFEYETRDGKHMHDFSGWTPDIVVINGGTNDQGHASLENFKAGCAALLARAREVYPKAHIFWAYGLMGNRFAPVLDELFSELRQNDDKFHCVYFERITAEETGANGHPGVKGQARGALVLTEAIREVIGK